MIRSTWRAVALIVFTGDAGRGGHPSGQVLRGGAWLQRHGHGAPRPQPRGPLQLLQQKTQSQNCPPACWSAGKLLVNIFVRLNECFSLSADYVTLKIISFQLNLLQISRIEFIHGKNFIHRDMKPDNFLMGLGKKVTTFCAFLVEYLIIFLTSGQPVLCDRFWSGQKVPGPSHPPAHSLPGAQESHGHGPLHQHQHPSRNRWNIFSLTLKVLRIFIWVCANKTQKLWGIYFSRN